MKEYVFLKYYTTSYIFTFAPYNCIGILKCILLLAVASNFASMNSGDRKKIY